MNASPWIQSFRLSIQCTSTPTSANPSDVPSCARDFACVLVVTSTGSYPRLDCYLQRLNNILSDAARRHSWQWPWAGFSENRHVYREFPLLCLLCENTYSPLREIVEAWVRIKSARLERTWRDTCEYVYMCVVKFTDGSTDCCAAHNICNYIAIGELKKGMRVFIISFGEDGIRGSQRWIAPYFIRLSN